MKKGKKTATRAFSLILAVIMLAGCLTVGSAAKDKTPANEVEFLNEIYSSSAGDIIRVDKTLEINAAFDVPRDVTVIITEKLTVRNICVNYGIITGKGELNVTGVFDNRYMLYDIDAVTNSGTFTVTSPIHNVGKITNTGSFSSVEQTGGIFGVSLIENSARYASFAVNHVFNNTGIINNTGKFSFNVASSANGIKEISNSSTGILTVNSPVLSVERFENDGELYVNDGGALKVSFNGAFYNRGTFINNGDFYCGEFSGQDITANSGSRYFGMSAELGGVKLGRLEYDLTDSEGINPEAEYPYMLGENVAVVADQTLLGIKRGGYNFICFTDSSGKRYNKGEYISMTADDLTLFPLWSEKAITTAENPGDLLGLNPRERATAAVTLNLTDTELLTNFVRLSVDLLDATRKAGTTKYIIINAGNASLTIPSDINQLMPDLDQIAKLAGYDRRNLTVKLLFENLSADKKATDAIKAQLLQMTPASELLSVKFLIQNQKGETIYTADENMRFAKGITLSLKSSRTAETLPLRYGAYRWGADGRLSFVPHRKSERDGSLYIDLTINGSGTYLLGETVYSFADTGKNWAAEFISLAYAKKLVSGVSGDLYKPDSYVTRAQFAQMTANLLGFGKFPAAQAFSDIASDKWYYDCVGMTVSAGLFAFIEGDRFLPDEYITREEMAAVIANTLAFTGKKISAAAEVLEPFTDSGSINPRFRDAVSAVAAEGIMNGVSADLFNPQGRTNRAQCAAILIRTAIAAGFMDK